MQLFNWSMTTRKVAVIAANTVLEMMLPTFTRAEIYTAADGVLRHFSMRSQLGHYAVSHN